MSLSLSPNSLYRQTTDCTEGGGLTREHCIYVVTGTESSMKLNKSNGKNTDSVSMKMQNSTMYRIFNIIFLITSSIRNNRCSTYWSDVKAFIISESLNYNIC
jgi:hypothetical protein